MDGWMDGWVDGWMDGWMYGWIDFPHRSVEDKLDISSCPSADLNSYIALENRCV